MGESQDYSPRPYVLIGAVAGAALAALYIFHLFYLQFLLMVWGGSVMAGFAVHEKRSGHRGGLPIALGDAERLVDLQQTLAAVEERLTKPTSEEESGHLRARKAALERDVRKLKWSIREEGLERLRNASNQEGLKPLPPRREPRAQRRQEGREQAHLFDSLDEAEEVLASEPPGSARTRVQLIAADVKAHYHLLRALEYRSRNLGDYAVAWAALASISRGASLEFDVGAHASKKVKARLEELFSLARARGMVARTTDSAGDFAENWK